MALASLIRVQVQDQIKFRQERRTEEGRQDEACELAAQHVVWNQPTEGDEVVLYADDHAIMRLLSSFEC